MKQALALSQADRLEKEGDIQAACELRRLHEENQNLRKKMQSKREIFQAGRDSYKTACCSSNTDEEAWMEYSVTNTTTGEKE